MKNKCPGSGTVQMLSWLPDKDGYPGAAVCIKCSGGVQVLKGSVHEATSESGFEGLAGTLKAHHRAAAH